MLEVADIHVSYGKLPTLHGVSLTARPGEITCLLGRNGAGKSTTLKAIMGQLQPTQGDITLEAEAIHTRPAHEIPKLGIGYIPQGRRLFPEMTVAENIEVGLMTRGQGAATRDWVLGLFPRLKERMGQAAGTLSGGEQQMLATARALCLRPQVLLLDEPTEGLQPSVIALIREVIEKMKDEGVAIVLVEQRLDAILALADHAVILENGKTAASMDRDALHADPARLKHFLGV